MTNQFYCQFPYKGNTELLIHFTLYRAAKPAPDDYDEITQVEAKFLTNGIETECNLEDEEILGLLEQHSDDWVCIDCVEFDDYWQERYAEENY